MVVSVAETPGQDSGRHGRERRAQANCCRSVESGLQACEGQPGSGWRGRTVDCGVRGQPFGQPLQALEPTVVRDLLSSASAAGRYSEGEWWDATVGSLRRSPDAIWSRLWN